MRRVIGMGLRGISAVFILSGVAVVGETILAFAGILDQQYVQQFVLDALNDNGLLRTPVSIALPLL